MPSPQERMRQVYKDREELVARLLEGDSAFQIRWSHKEAALGLGFPVDFLQSLQGKTLRTDVDEEGVTLRLTDQQLESEAIGRRLWDDLVAGFIKGEKETTSWRETYKLLWVILEAAYANTSIKDYLKMAADTGTLRPQAFEASSFNEIYNFVMDGGDLSVLDLDVADLHLAATTIYYLILPPGTRNEIGVTPETIGSAATR